MSITLNTRSIVLLVALAGVLVGFAVSQVTSAESRRSVVVVKDTAALKELRGQTKLLRKIENSTNETCKAVTDTGLFGRCD